MLRRSKRGGRPAREAAIMEHAQAHGFSVPHVLEVLDDRLADPNVTDAERARVRRLLR